MMTTLDQDESGLIQTRLSAVVPIHLEGDAACPQYSFYAGRQRHN